MDNIFIREIRKEEIKTYQASLSVQKANYAVKLYKNVGFEVIREQNEEYVMRLQLN